MEFLDVKDRFVVLTERSEVCTNLNSIVSVLDLQDLVAEDYSLKDLVSIKYKKKVPLVGVYQTKYQSKSVPCASITKVPLSVEYTKHGAHLTFTVFVCNTALFTSKCNLEVKLDIEKIQVSSGYSSHNGIWKFYLCVFNKSVNPKEQQIWVSCSYSLVKKSVVDVMLSFESALKLDEANARVRSKVRNALSGGDNVLVGKKWTSCDGTTCNYIFNRNTADIVEIVTNSIGYIRSSYGVKGDSVVPENIEARMNISEDDYAEAHYDFEEGSCGDVNISVEYSLEGVSLGGVDIPLKKFLIDGFRESDLEDACTPFEMYQVLFGYLPNQETRGYFSYVDDKLCLVFITKVAYNVDELYYESSGSFTAWGKVLVTAYFAEEKRFKVLKLSDISKLPAYVREYGSMIY